MNFFKTSEGGPHAGRIAALIYIIALGPGCNYFRDVDTTCLLRIVSTVGWCLSFAAKRPVVTWADMLTPVRLIGLIMITVGLFGQFFVPGHR